MPERFGANVGMVREILGKLYLPVGKQASALYAETMHAHLDKVPFDLEKALKRVLALTIGRLTAYGARWREWVDTSRLRTAPNTIGLRHRNKALLRQEPDGDYSIADPLVDAATRLQLMRLRRDNN